ncbi:MAG: TRAP transporter large permease subunit [Chloroflexi bacterium]|nr:TRAP transporter large permease subunit [Chloroflexota bacterium]
MDLSTIIILYLVALFVLIFGGVPVAFALGLLSIGSLYFGFGAKLLPALGNITWDGLATFVIASIPLFIFMGYLLFETGLSTRIYDGIYPLLDRLLPGGLLHSNIVVGAIFAACSGSSMANTASIGSVALPEMEKRGYERSIAAGSVSAGGTLGILIPPSITMIVYGAMTDQSVGRLFIGGIIPGLVLAGFYMSSIALRLQFQPHLAPARRKKESWGKLLKGLTSVWPVLALIVAVLGSIYLGVATPTEAAAIGCAIVLILAAAYRSVSWSALKRSLAGSVKTGSMVLCIYLGAKLMGIYLSNANIPSQLADMVTSLGLPKMAVFMFVFLLYLILGMLMDSLAAIVMTLPITFPVVMSLGFDPIWYGVIVTMFGEAGLITPPVGMNLFILQGLRPQYPYWQIVKGCMFFFWPLLLVIFLVMFFPSLVTFLPRMMLG